MAKLVSRSLIYLCITLYLLNTFAQSSNTESLEGVEYQYEVSSDTDKLVRVRRHAPTASDISSSLGTTTPIVSTVKRDRTEYYDIHYISDITDSSYKWVDLTTLKSGVVKHKSLQSAYRLAVKVRIGFPFLFYGHTVEHATIATGGFLYMSDFLHSFLTASQYVAPLMANFDTSIGKNESEILHSVTDEAFIAQWSNVYLKDKRDLGPFNFQVQLHKNEGKIVAVYKNIPAPIANVTSDAHPVKIGLSDAYYWDVGQYRTIYPYHTYNASIDAVQSDSAIVYTHRQTCNMLDTCDSCLNDPPKNFRCYWCSKLNRCSDAFDRQRQDWIFNGCVHNITQTDCDMMFTTPASPHGSAEKTRNSSQDGSQAWKAITAALCTIFALTALGVLVAVVYGYRNPHSSLGMFLVRNRPSELWRKFKAWKDKDEDGSGGMNQM